MSSHDKHAEGEGAKNAKEFHPRVRLQSGGKFALSDPAASAPTNWIIRRRSATYAGSESDDNRNLLISAMIQYT